MDRRKFLKMGGLATAGFLVKPWETFAQDNTIKVVNELNYEFNTLTLQQHGEKNFGVALSMWSPKAGNDLPVWMSMSFSADTSGRTPDNRMSQNVIIINKLEYQYDDRSSNIADVELIIEPRRWANNNSALTVMPVKSPNATITQLYEVKKLKCSGLIDVNVVDAYGNPVNNPGDVAQSIKRSTAVYGGLISQKADITRIANTDKEVADNTKIFYERVMQTKPQY